MLAATTSNIQRGEKCSLVRITQTPASVLWALSLRLGLDSFHLLFGVKASVYVQNSLFYREFTQTHRNFRALIPHVIK